MATLSLAGGEAATATRPAAATEGDPFSGDRLFQDVVSYGTLGEHRTATTVDVATSDWLVGGLRATGFEAERQPYTLQQFFFDRAELTVDDLPLTAFPLWWPAVTGSEGITAPLVRVGEELPSAAVKGKIAYIKLPFEVIIRGSSVFPGSGIGERLRPVAEAGAVAIVAVTEHPTGDIMALNAMAGLDPWPVPILLVGSRSVGPLDVAAVRGGTASLVLEGRYDRQATAYEVVGRIRRGSELVVVSTPSSGWFECAGERGPGIALWLALARWAAGRSADQSYLFVASSGHELSGTGIRHFVERLAPPPKEVKCWLHLGAGVATWDFQATEEGVRRLDRPYPLRRLETTSDDLATILTPFFRDLPGLKPAVSRHPAGETRLMAEKGYRTFGFSGGSWYHHMPGDTPARITGPSILEPVGRALEHAMSRIETTRMV